MKENNLTNEQLRMRAIELYKNNWNVSEICRTLNRSRNWFYKWLNKYNSNDSYWYKEQSRTPKTKKNKTNTEMENLIIQTRKELLSNPYMQYGPQAIYYTLTQKGINPPPVWTISRILKRHNLTKNKPLTSYIPKGKEYPYEYINSQQMDIVGPRHLASKARYYFHSIIYCDTHYSQISVLKSQSSDNICNSLIRFWKIAGIPDFLQMDNYLSFWGSLKKPNALGKIIRLCLLLGITPVFIPVKEPWRNGIVEHFNNTLQTAILNSGHYTSLDDVQKASNAFTETHNNTHHYSTQNGMTPIQRMKYLHYPISLLDKNFVMPKERLPLNSGEIHVIRFIRSNLKFNIFGLSFTLPKETQYEYIKGVIITDEHRLMIFKDQEYITEFQFLLY